MTSISIQYVNPAKEGKRYGTIKTRDGQSYMLPAGMADAFQPNTTVDVPLKQETWGKGDEAKVVLIINGRPANGNAQQQPAPPPVNQSSTSAMPSGQAQQHVGSARMADPKDVLIFVTGVVGRSMGSGSFGVTDIDLLTKAALAAYRANLSGQ